MSSTFDLDAPIVPGESAAGIRLGDDISTILECAKPIAVRNLLAEWRGIFPGFDTWGVRPRVAYLYEFGPVCLWITAESTIGEIGLYEGHRGKIAEKIGIGSSQRAWVARLCCPE